MFNKFKKKIVVDAFTTDEILALIDDFRTVLHRKYNQATEQDSKRWWDTEACAMLDFKNYVLDRTQHCDLEQCNKHSSFHPHCNGSCKQYNTCVYQKNKEKLRSVTHG